MLVNRRGLAAFYRRSNGRDDVAKESSFATLARESVHDEDDATTKETRASLFECVKLFDDRTTDSVVTRRWTIGPPSSTSEADHRSLGGRHSWGSPHCHYRS